MNVNTTPPYDVIVLGLGGMGSAAAAHLAKRGKRVLGLEQFALGHDRGASSGRTRMIRKAYFEGPAYVPLLVRAYELWRQLEAETSSTLLDLVGLLMVGSPDGPLVRNALLSIQRYGLDIEKLGTSEIVKRFPQTKLAKDEIALFEPDAGIVFPERAIAAHQQVARSQGAVLRGDARVASWQRRSTGALSVELVDGTIAEADQLVICAGPWLTEVARQLKLPISLQRNVQIWFAPETGAFARGRFPAFVLEREGLPKPVYGFPDLGQGVKAALHGYGAASATADSLDREIHPGDIAVVKSALDAWLPGAAGEYRFGKACLYAMTPDEDFIIDRHPSDDGVVIAGGFSGHGYKFCSVVGEVVADLLARKSRPDIEFLSLRRFGS